MFRPSLFGQFVASLALVGAASACDSLPGASSTAAPAVTVSTDLARLRSAVALPSGVVSGRWLVHPVGSSGTRLLPGPTDTVLLAYLETSPDFWSEQGFLFPLKNKPPVRLRAADAKQLLPASVVQGATLSGDEYQLVGCETRSPDAANKATRHAIMAARCGTALLIAYRGE
jgi:hypothetical protein